MRYFAMADHGCTALQQWRCGSCDCSVLADDGRGAPFVYAQSSTCGAQAFIQDNIVVHAVTQQIQQ